MSRFSALIALFNMFDFAVAKQDQRNRRMGPLLAISAGFHGFAIVAWLGVGQLQVPAVSEPSDLITFFEFASLSLPPPAPPPPRKKSSARRVERTVVEKNVAPKEIPVEDPPKEETSRADESDPLAESDSGAGSKDGDPNGDPDGVDGSLGVGDPEEPPKVAPKQKPQPPAEVRLDESIVRRKRLRGRDPAYPPAAESRGVEATLVVTLKIGADGRVKEIIFGRSHPMFEHAIREAVEGWIFQPHEVNGQKVPMVTTYRFAFRLL